MTPETAKKAFIIYNDVYKTGEPARSVELEFISKDGSTKYVEVTILLSRDRSGNPIGFTAFSTDISEKKRAEISLKKSEEKYRNILNNMLDGYSESDLNGKLTLVNRSIYEVMGYTEEEFKNLDLKALMPPESEKKIIETYTSVYKTGNPVRNLRYDVITKDGQIKFNEASIDLLRDEIGRPIGFSSVTRDITSRKLAEIELKNSEEKYRNILKNMSDGYTEVDLSGTNTFTNKMAYDFLGYTKEEYTNINYQDLMTPEDAKKVFDIYNNIYKTGKPAKLFEYDCIAKDGSKKTIEVNASLKRDESGKPIGFTSLSRDVTNKKQAEKELKESEEKYRTILDNIDYGYYESNLSGKFTFFNDTLCVTHEYSRDELMNLDYRQYMDNENAEKVYNYYNTAYTTEKPIKDLEYEIITKNGIKKNMEASVALILDSRGKKIGFRGVVKDITQRKLAEITLKNSEEKYRNILDTMSDGYTEVDLTSKITFSNKTAYEYLGYTLEEYTSMDYKQYMPPETAKKVFNVYHEAYETGKPVSFFEYD
ncbi:MAG: PAS domain S-box protein, partial [Desulfobacterales bacterium]|nr:PAS domain S-box protein [Desulfobacterales bacterium]